MKPGKLTDLAAELHAEAIALAVKDDVSAFAQTDDFEDDIPF